MPSPKLTAGDAMMIGTIVGNCHCGSTNLQVCRTLWSKMGGVKCYKVPKAYRRAAMRHATKKHRQNRKQYCLVMRGW